ncbi:MAG: hypothetical protein JW910_01415 [Anaerolineae bacterium]|nr:hypothetical protein [Anaerolineae bacterium]
MALDLIINWIGREGGAVIGWWLALTLLGLAAWPLAFRLLRGLPDRGYALARTFGLLLTGFIFWLGASLGLWVNSSGSVLLAALVVIVAGLLWRGEDSPIRWARENWKYMLLVEVLFLVLFVGWAFFRAHNPDTFTTEKGMDLAFLSAVGRSQSFPPNDPWMAGYSISYYHFGYILAAMLTKLVNVGNATGFSLMIVTLFSLAGVSTFGVVYNLIRARASWHRRKELGEPTPRKHAVIFALLGMFFVVLMGNLSTPLIELPHRSTDISAAYLEFWDMAERNVPRSQSLETCIEERGEGSCLYWWWFRASRVVQDRDLNGTPIAVQPIDEFPMFSFILADMHPHVLGLPFAVLAIGLALNVLLIRNVGPTRRDIVLYAICVGALVFLNTWDGPIYMAVLLGAEALRRLLVNGDGRLKRPDWWALLRLGLWLVGLTLLFYLPFFIGFRSQLGGVLPNVIFPTRIQQFFLMFGPFVIILLAFLAVEYWRGRESLNWGLAWSVIGLGLLTLVLAVVALGVVAWLRADVRNAVYQVLDSAGGLLAQLGPILAARVSGLPLLLLLGGMVAFVVARLFGRLPELLRGDDEPVFPASSGFALLLVAVGALLVLVPDYAYLRDNFAVRMNTVFKMYYQAWLVWAIASAYAAYSILMDVNFAARPARSGRVAFGAVLAILVGAGALYPVMAIRSRAYIEAGRDTEFPAPLTLDGSLTIAGTSDYAVIQCLMDVVGDSDAVLLEAIGAAYHPEQGGRVSALTGIPTVLAWENHERQWRGATYDAVVGTRVQDIERLYSDLSWPAVRSIVAQYGIDYIYVGAAERSRYDALGLSKFDQVLTPVCQNGDTVVYSTGQ